MELLLLTKELTQQYCRKILMPEGATEILMDIADKINHDPQLFEIYWEFYKSYIDSGYWTTIWEPLTIHPYVKEVIGKEASLFYLHAALQRLPLTEQKYSEKGLSQELFVETLKDIGVWVQHAFHLVGYYAIGNFSWIWRHLEAKMFRLGGMQFMATPFSGIVKGFYNIKEDAILLLCGEGMELRANGDMQGVCNQEKTTDGYVTEYQETEDYFLGHPITPIGKGIRQQVKLKKTEWKKYWTRMISCLRSTFQEIQHLIWNPSKTPIGKLRSFTQLISQKSSPKGWSAIHGCLLPSSVSCCPRPAIS